jgi:hypothetical protein
MKNKPPVDVHSKRIAGGSPTSHLAVAGAVAVVVGQLPSPALNPTVVRPAG